tara:strand:- start:12 stop:182 length:171 start_codon:yes stop_codon:yes gene_type:complete
MFDLTHGILFFFIGCSMTLVGFFIAFLVINYNQSKEYKKEFTEVEKSLQKLNDKGQ